ncbi:MAG TPA: PadR family transcriptional regulator [Gammaproteobacteria bacterium]
MTLEDGQPEIQLRKFQKELNAGTVALVLMAALDGAKEPLYGYQIAKQLEAADDRMVSGKQSALYPVLRNLSAAGLLESWVEPSVSGPPRRYYRITTDGRVAFKAWKSAWEKTRAFVDHMLENAHD